MSSSAVESTHIQVIRVLKIALVVLGSLVVGFGYRNFDYYSVAAYVFPLTFVVVAYLIAKWANSAIQLKRFLNVLNNLSQLRNTYSDADKLLAAGLERLREFYGATYCFVVASDTSEETHI